MPRVSREQAAQSKERIIKQAARLFRMQGYHATGLDQVMKEAGLTVGTFYAHFDSKQNLLAQVLNYLLPQINSELMGDSAEGLDFGDWIKAFSDSYLATSHRDTPEQGCPIPSLAAELARADSEVADTLDKILRQSLKRQTTTVEKKLRSQAEDILLAHLALGVGAISLSRALGDSPLSNQVLRAARRLAGSISFPSK